MLNYQKYDFIVGFTTMESGIGLDLTPEVNMRVSDTHVLQFKHNDIFSEVNITFWQQYKNWLEQWEKVLGFY